MSSVICGESNPSRCARSLIILLVTRFRHKVVALWLLGHFRIMAHGIQPKLLVCNLSTISRRN